MACFGLLKWGMAIQVYNDMFGNLRLSCLHLPDAYVCMCMHGCLCACDFNQCTYLFFLDIEAVWRSPQYLLEIKTPSLT